MAYTEQQLRERIVAKINSWVGCTRGDATHKKILEIYNSRTPLPRGHKMVVSDAWCAATASAAVIDCGLAHYMDIIECSVNEMIAKAQKLGWWVEDDAYMPKVGDMICYAWSDKTNYTSYDNRDSAGHIGIVTSVGNKQFVVTEGNMTSASKCGRRSMSQNGRYIRGFIAPNYAAIAAQMNGAVSSSNTGSTSSSKGYDNGSCTAAQVKEMQTYYGLTVDGFWGPNSRSTTGMTADAAWAKYNELKVTGNVSADITKLWSNQKQTGAYGVWRSDSGHYHAGIDMVDKVTAYAGGPIRAFVDGRVITVHGNTNARGFYIVIEDKYGYKHIYQHLQKLPTLKVGASVKIGDIVGRMGGTGGSTTYAVHLHYEVRTPSNPYSDSSVGPTFSTNGNTTDLERYTANPETYLRNYAVGTVAAPSTPVVVPSANTKSYTVGGTNEETIYNFATQVLGFNSAAACGLLANIAKESNFNPTALGDSGTSYGICQWHASRYTSLKNWCSKNGRNYVALDGQLWYLKYELESSYASTLAAMKAVANTATGAYNAAVAWCKNFEKPTNVGTVSVQRGNLAKTTYWPRYNGSGSKGSLTAQNPYTAPTRTLKKGSRGDDVKWLQWMLSKQGFGTIGLSLEKFSDGSFGAQTEKSVRAWQSTQGLAADGSFGPKSLARMLTL